MNTSTELKQQRDSKRVLSNISLDGLETFFGSSFPKHLKASFEHYHFFAELDQQQIMRIIDFAPPFLKIHRMVIGAPNPSDPLHSKSLSMGVVTQADTEGHYNRTIFLALCGQLMASSASIHLAHLFPNSAPQVIKANGVKPVTFSDVDGQLWQPSKKGTRFFVESEITRKKMQLVLMKTSISFEGVHYGVIDELRLVLMPASSISFSKELPPAT